MKEKPRLTHFDERLLLVKQEVFEQREKICNDCYAKKPGEDICQVNGEPLTGKLRQKGMMCPLGFWSANYEN